MINNKSTVNIDKVNNSDKEFIIKDKVGITLGRIQILDFEKENKSCLIKFNFYKNNDKSIFYIRDTLKTILYNLFIEEELEKIDLIVLEDINMSFFQQFGFKLEGVVSNSININGDQKSKFILGIDKKTFNNNIGYMPFILKGRNISLKVLTPEDAEKVLNYYIKNKGYLDPYEPTRDNDFYTLKEQRQILIESYRNYLNGLEISCGIYKEQKLIGKIRLSNIIYGSFRNGIIGYSIDEEEQGKGYMKESLRLILKYSFEELKLHRLEASTLIDNIKSQRVLKACGFNELGVNKEYLYINGKWRDHLTFYILND